MKSYERKCFSVFHRSHQRNEHCDTCNEASREHDRGLRAHWIKLGAIRPMTERPTFRLLPGEREKFEAEALAWLEWSRTPMIPVQEVAVGAEDVWN